MQESVGAWERAFPETRAMVWGLKEKMEEEEEEERMEEEEETAEAGGGHRRQIPVPPAGFLL